MILRVSEDCVWNLRAGRNVNRRVPGAKEQMCLWRKKGQFHLHSIERTPVPEAKERCVFGERGTSPSPFNRKKSSARSKRKMCLWRKDDNSITIHLKNSIATGLCCWVEINGTTKPADVASVFFFLVHFWIHGRSGRCCGKSLAEVLLRSFAVVG
jgi:hypothetical protein